MYEGILRVKCNINKLEDIDFIEGFTVCFENRIYDFALEKYNFDNETLEVVGKIDGYTSNLTTPSELYIQGSFKNGNEPLVIAEAYFELVGSGEIKYDDELIQKCNAANKNYFECNKIYKERISKIKK